MNISTKAHTKNYKQGIETSARNTIFEKLSYAEVSNKYMLITIAPCKSSSVSGYFMGFDIGHVETLTQGFYDGASIAKLDHKGLLHLNKSSILVNQAVVNKMPMAARCEGLWPTGRFKNVERYDWCIGTCC